MENTSEARKEQQFQEFMVQTKAEHADTLKKNPTSDLVIYDDSDPEPIEKELDTKLNTRMKLPKKKKTLTPFYSS